MEIDGTIAMLKELDNQMKKCTGDLKKSVVRTSKIFSNRCDGKLSVHYYVEVQGQQLLLHSRIKKM